MIKVLSIAKRMVKWIFIGLGSVMLFILLLSLTTRPYFLHHWLGTGIKSDTCRTETIVLFGASGIPSGESLVRTFYAAQAHKAMPEVPIYICMVGDTTNKNGSPYKIAAELELRGVPPANIKLLMKGKNTRGQVLELSGMSLGAVKNSCILVVTSPTHMRRCLLSLKKEGFQHLAALPAFETPLDGELLFDDAQLGGKRRVITPDAGQNLDLRYEMWTQLNYLLMSTRELAALSYYWMRGWI
jgi:uncharacterized SAM-binding protein YcdF (DUF218 family)